MYTLVVYRTLGLDIEKPPNCQPDLSDIDPGKENCKFNKGTAYLAPCSRYHLIAQSRLE